MRNVLCGFDRNVNVVRKLILRNFTSQRLYNNSEICQNNNFDIRTLYPYEQIQIRPFFYTFKILYNIEALGECQTLSFVVGTTAQTVPRQME